jgi:hypothetical protein
MRKLLIALLLFPYLAFSQITFFGVSVNPADNGSAGSSTLTSTPPASMQLGDLIVVVCSQAGTATFSVNNDGGQSWTALTRQQSSTTRVAQTFWARFDGTWDANPIFNYTGATAATSLSMLVFRPSGTSYAWTNQVDNTATFGTGSSTISITGVTPAEDNNVSIAVWMSGDDNTWGNLAGTGWTKTGLGAQYRNTNAGDASITFAYQIQSTAAATNNVSQDQLTLGNDAGVTLLTNFYETGSGYTSPIKNRVVND